MNQDQFIVLIRRIEAITGHRQFLDRAKALHVRWEKYAARNRLFQIAATSIQAANQQADQILKSHPSQSEPCGLIGKNLHTAIQQLELLHHPDARELRCMAEEFAQIEAEIGAFVALKVKEAGDA